MCVFLLTIGYDDADRWMVLRVRSLGCFDVGSSLTTVQLTVLNKKKFKVGGKAFGLVKASGYWSCMQNISVFFL